MFLGSIICIPDEDKAAERDRMFLSGEAPPMAPFPILTDGFLARDAAGQVMAPAGQLSPHGIVRHKGRTDRFDSFVSPGLTLILTPEIDLDRLSDASRATLHALNVRVVTIADRRDATDRQFADTQGQFLPFMARHKVKAMLVRPDLYIFGGAAEAGGIDAVIAELDQQAREFGLFGRGRQEWAASA